MQYAVIIIRTICIPNDRRLQKPSYQPSKMVKAVLSVKSKARSAMTKVSIKAKT
jgi:hypothetical protein